MSEIEENTSSAEEKFFGVKTRHGNLSAADDSSEDSDIEVELAEDAAPADKEPEKKGVPLVNYSKDLTDEELAAELEKLGEKPAHS